MRIGTILSALTVLCEKEVVAKANKMSISDEQSSVLWALHRLSHLIGKTNLKYYAVISFTDKGNSLGPIRR